MKDSIMTLGNIEMIVDYNDGRPSEIYKFPNTVLNKGREALASSLANDFGTTYNFFVTRMLFGDGGTFGGEPQFVDAGRNGLFGITRANKPVISQVDQLVPTQAILTAIVTFNEANGFILNEMALQMNTGDLFSMATFPDLSKTDQMQITWNWQLNFI